MRWNGWTAIRRRRRRCWSPRGEGCRSFPASRAASSRFLRAYVWRAGFLDGAEGFPARGVHGRDELLSLHEGVAGDAGPQVTEIISRARLRAPECRCRRRPLRKMLSARSMTGVRRDRAHAVLRVRAAAELAQITRRAGDAGLQHGVGAAVGPGPNRIGRAEYAHDRAAERDRKMHRPGIVGHADGRAADQRRKLRQGRLARRG